MLLLKKIILFFILVFVVGITHIDSSTKKYEIKITDSKLVKYWTLYYAKEYQIPKEIAFNILKKETRWNEKDTLYIATQVGDHKRDKKNRPIKGTERAFGPGQIHLQTAHGIWKDKTITKERLKKDIEFNIHTMCKILKYNYDYFRDVKDKNRRWLYAINCYNTGIPNFELNNRQVNQYALDVFFKSFKIKLI